MKKLTTNALLIAMSISFSACSSTSGARLTSVQVAPGDLAAFLDTRAFKARVTSKVDFNEVAARVVFSERDSSGTFKEVGSIEKVISTTARNPSVVAIFSDERVYLAIDGLGVAKRVDWLNQITAAAKATAWQNEVFEHDLDHPVILMRTSRSGEPSGLHINPSDDSGVAAKVELYVSVKRKQQ